MRKMNIVQKKIPNSGRMGENSEARKIMVISGFIGKK